MSAFYTQKCDLIKIMQKEIHKIFFTRYYCKLLRKTPIKKLAILCEKHDKVLLKIQSLYEKLKLVYEWGWFWNSHEFWVYCVLKQLNLLRHYEKSIIEYIDNESLSKRETDFMENHVITSSGFFVYMHLAGTDDGRYINMAIKTGKPIEYLKVDFMEKFNMKSAKYKKSKIVPLNVAPVNVSRYPNKHELLRYIDNAYFTKPTYSVVEADGLLSIEKLQK